MHQFEIIHFYCYLLYLAYTVDHYLLYVLRSAIALASSNFL